QVQESIDGFIQPFAFDVVPVDAVDVVNNDPDLPQPNAQIQLTATAKVGTVPIAAATFEWLSDYAEVTVDPNGLVTISASAVAGTLVTITATEALDRTVGTYQFTIVP